MTVHQHTNQKQHSVGLDTKPYKRKTVYTASDTESLPNLVSMPGQAPFLRGPYASMYTQRPWTIRQYTGMSTAQDTNALFHAALAQGAQGLSVAFDLPTHRGMDSDNLDAVADVGMAGVPIDSVEDMKQLFAGIDLSRVSVSMTMNGAVLPVLASFIVAAEESGVAPDTLSGTIQNDILKEFIVRNTYIFPPKQSMRICCDVVEYVSQHIPKFNAMSVSGYHFQEGGADPVLELALTLANAELYVSTLKLTEMDADAICSKLSFFFGVGSDFYLEIAKLRAARVLWCNIAERLGATTDKAKALRMHCQTSGWSLVAQESANNTVRTTLQAMAAVFGGTQSLHTNAFDEALSLPTPESSRLARNTQLIMQLETGICDVVDPWAGSYMMESMTADVISQVGELLNEISKQGGMMAAIESGWVTQRIHQSSLSIQAKLERSEIPIVGLNVHKEVSLPNLQTSLVQHKHVLETQLQQLKAVKNNRDQINLKRCLNNLKAIARSGKGNLLEATIAAIRARATIGECTLALATVWAFHSEKSRFTSNLFGEYMNGNDEWDQVCIRVKNLNRKMNRQASVFIGKLGQDGHDRGAKLIASALEDAGFEVKLGSLFSNPTELLNQALEFNADLIGVSSLSGSHMQLMREFMHTLRLTGLDLPIVIGGVIPPRDAVELISQGVNNVFCSGVSIVDIIKVICSCIDKEFEMLQTGSQ